MPKYQCIIIFPVYKSLDELEKKSIKRGISMTQGFKQAFIAPESFDLDQSFEDFSAIEIFRFENRFFEGIKGYNLLMLSKRFYKRFQEYEYILIHQTDAYLFKPALNYWCELGYDYIGAPWLDPKKNFKSKFRQFFFETVQQFFFEKTENCLQYLKVGNGGLSLRKTSSFIEVLDKVPKIPFFLYNKLLINSFNEDLFWGIMASKIKKNFNIPDWEKALGFAIETKPSYAYQLNGRQLPFACHAIDKYEPDFWKQHIQ